MGAQTEKQRLPLPGHAGRLQEVALQILRLPHLLELKVTPNGLDVMRHSLEGEPVVPESLVELARGLEAPLPDLPFLLGHIEVEELPFDPTRHPLHTLMGMFDAVSLRNLYPVCWFVREGDSLDAFLALPVGTKPAVFLGQPVYYVTSEELPEARMLLVGARTRQAIDATYGITADIGG